MADLWETEPGAENACSLSQPDWRALRVVNRDRMRLASSRPAPVGPSVQTSKTNKGSCVSASPRLSRPRELHTTRVSPRAWGTR